MGSSSHAGSLVAVVGIFALQAGGFGPVWFHVGQDMRPRPGSFICSAGLVFILTSNHPTLNPPPTTRNPKPHGPHTMHEGEIVRGSHSPKIIAHSELIVLLLPRQLPRLLLCGSCFMRPCCKNPKLLGS